MSLRQLKKLANRNLEEEEEEAVSDSPVVHNKRTNLFAALNTGSDASPSSSSSEEEPREKPVPRREAQPKKTKSKKKIQAPVKTEAEIPEEEDLDEILADLSLQPDEHQPQTEEVASTTTPEIPAIFRLDRNCMNPEQEAKRLFGGGARPTAGGSHARRPAGGAAGGGLRRFVFVTPDDEWPKKVRGNLRTEKTSEAGEFELRSTEEYEKQLGKLFEVSEVQSFDLLIDFIRKYPFNVHALLSVVEVFRQVRQFEQAMEILRRAIFALECEMHYDFEPTKAPRISENSVFNFALLKTLLLYVQLLIGQGCLETALEISKFLVVVDRKADRTHSLLRLDLLAVRAKKHDTLENWNRQFSRNFLLSDVLPNFAYSLALSRYFRLPDLHAGLSAEISVEAVISEDPEIFGQSVSGVLIRALLKFPLVLKALVAKWQDKTRLDWLRVFAQAPFSDATSPATIGRIADAYAEHAASFWRPDVLQSWLFACAQQCVSLAQDQRVVEFRKRNIAILKTREVEELLSRYSDVMAAEFNASIADFVLPKSIIDNDEYVLSIYRPNYSRARPGQAAGPANVSLDSNPLFVFLQTLMPWARVDTAGTQAQPVTVAGFVDRLRDALGAAPPQDNPPDEGSGSDSGEIDMDQQ